MAGDVRGPATGVLERARDIVERLLPRGAATLAALIFVSYGLGLVRDRQFAGTFGAGVELDAYHAAFVLSELPRSATRLIGGRRAEDARTTDAEVHRRREAAGVAPAVSRVRFSPACGPWITGMLVVLRAVGDLDCVGARDSVSLT